MSTIDPQVAASLGFPKLRYVFVEHERRWLCKSVPHEQIIETDHISDLYVTGTSLRLREARNITTGQAMRRLTRKVDVEPETRLISSVYLSEVEFNMLRTSLQGRCIEKKRHRLRASTGVAMSVDEFEGELCGLALLEVEFDTTEDLRAFVAPDFAGAEVTDDLRFTGGRLVVDGVPIVGSGLVRGDA